MPRWLEALYPSTVAILVGIVVYILKVDITDVNNFSSIISSAVTISSIVIAFIATMISILISISNSAVMKRINNNSAEGMLISYIKTTVVSGLLLAMYSLVLNMYLDMEGIFSRLMLIIFVVMLVYFVLCTYRIISIVTGVLTQVLSENKEKDQKEKSKPVFTPQINQAKDD